MADNVQFQSTQLATPASGTTVSTDEAASGHIQRVKLAYSADGVDTHVTADASGLLINPGNAHIDAVHDAMALTDQAIAVKAAIFGHNSGGAGSYEPVKVTPSGALTVEINDGGGSITVDGTVAATQSGTWNLNNIGGTISLPTGAATETSVAAVAAAASGSNLRVTLTNPTAVISSLAAVSTITSSASNTTLLAANTSRKGWSVFNDSNALCYVKFGATASTSSFSVRIEPYGYFESGPNVYGGQVDAIWASANGAARVSEW